MKKIIAMVLAMTIAAALAGCVTVTKKGDSSEAETTTSSAKETTVESKDEKSEGETTTVAETTTEETTTTEEEKSETYGIGSTAEIDGVKITLQSVNQGTGNEIIKPADGKTYIYFDFEIENGSDSDVAVSSIASFTSSFDDYAEDIDLVALSADTTKESIDGTVMSGKKLKGSLAFEVPSDWKTAEIVYQKNILYDATVTFVVNSSDIA